MIRLPKLRINWMWLAYGALATVVVHIIATLTSAYSNSNGAYARLSDGLPANTFIVLPPARPGSQVIPYQSPDTHYAICRFDTSAGPVAVKASLLTAGWTLTLYTAQGTSIYDAPGRLEGQINLNLLLVPPGGFFLGNSEMGNTQENDYARVVLPDNHGIAVIRAPIGGIAYVHETKRAIAAATCQAKPFLDSTGQ